MSKPVTCLLAAGVLLLPLPAVADCAERIAAVESHPAMAGADSGNKETAAAAPGNEEEVVQEQMIGGGEAVQEDGGETVHAEGGPAAPQESWFTDAEEGENGVVLTHLDAARQAQESGDEQACLEKIQQAEEALAGDAG